MAKIFTGLNIGLAIIVNTIKEVVKKKNRTTNPHIHTFLGTAGKNSAHLLDR